MTRHRPLALEVIAKHKDGSAPELCAEGQRIQATWVFTHNGKNLRLSPAEALGSPISHDPRYDSGVLKNLPQQPAPNDPYTPNPPDDPDKIERGPCHFGGADWCDDDFHGGGGASGVGRDGKFPTNGLKTYDGSNRIAWIDPPGFGVRPSDSVRANGLQFDAKFEARVTGTDGSECRCTWEAHVTVDKTGLVTRNEVPPNTIQCTPAG
jgi:hypothetical protein